MQIPGTTKLGRMEENLAAAELRLPEADLTEIEAVTSDIDVAGDC